MLSIRLDGELLLLHDSRRRSLVVLPRQHGDQKRLERIEARVQCRLHRREAPADALFRRLEAGVDLCVQQLAGVELP